MRNAYGYDDKQRLAHLEEKKLKRIMTALALVSGLALTGCSDSGYDNPDANSIELATEYFNEAAQHNGDPSLSREELEQYAKEHVCDQLPEDPSHEDAINHSEHLADKFNVKPGTAQTLIIQSTYNWCSSKYDSAFSDE